jgi:Fe-S cluster assembly iron-binding protein IscA
MLTLTEAAGAHLAELLDDRQCPEGVAVRFVCEEAGVSVVLDDQKPGDSTLEHEGRTVLILDENAAQHLDGETVDVEQTESGSQLVLAKKEDGSS